MQHLGLYPSPPANRQISVTNAIPSLEGNSPSYLSHCGGDHGELSEYKTSCYRPTDTKAPDNILHEPTTFDPFSLPLNTRPPSYTPISRSFRYAAHLTFRHAVSVTPTLMGEFPTGATVLGIAWDELTGKGWQTHKSVGGLQSLSTTDYPPLPSHVASMISMAMDRIPLG